MPSRDEKQWQQHIHDEANVLKEQQVAAGPEACPVVGPGPYGSHATNISVREAVLAERERCIRAAGLCAAEPTLREQLGAISARDREVAQAVISAVINAIRSDDEPE